MLLVAIACAAAAYFVANWIGDTLIEKVYLDQKAMQKRERAIVSELQTYVQENRISSRDTDAVARWSMSKSDTYVMRRRSCPIPRASIPSTSPTGRCRPWSMTFPNRGSIR